jgi:ferrochelatase
MGGPDSLDAVRPFLARLFSDPLIFPVPGARFLGSLVARLRAGEARRYYERIGGRSPLIDITARQARALEEALASDQVVTAAAFRYWGPEAKDAVAALERRGVRELVALPMYPQYCRATTLSSILELRRAANARGMELIEIDRFGAEPAFLAAVSATVLEALGELGPAARPHVVFSAHGVPESFVARGDPYVREVETTARAVAARLPADVPWHLAYQSRVGPIRWVEPATDVLLRRLGAEGVRELVLVPLSFVADHVETLDEMDLRLREVALSSGVRDVRRARALNDSPAFIEALAGLVRRRIGASACPRS